MENVPTLMSFDKGAYFKCIQEECQRLGYHWHEDIVKVINTADYGVPQIRKRMFIVGSEVGKIISLRHAPLMRTGE